MNYLIRVDVCYSSSVDMSSPMVQLSWNMLLNDSSSGWAFSLLTWVAFGCSSSLSDAPESVSSKLLNKKLKLGGSIFLRTSAYFSLKFKQIFWSIHKKKLNFLKIYRKVLRAILLLNFAIEFGLLSFRKWIVAVIVFGHNFINFSHCDLPIQSCPGKTKA